MGGSRSQAGGAACELCGRLRQEDCKVTASLGHKVCSTTAEDGAFPHPGDPAPGFNKVLSKGWGITLGTCTGCKSNDNTPDTNRVPEVYVSR